MSNPSQSSRPAPDPAAPEPLTVNVPAYAGTLEPPVPARIRQLRRNLVESMRDARSVKRAKAAGVALEEPVGFVGAVARAACALCQGWCCSKGGEHAYLDGPSMARIRRTRPPAF